MSRAVSGEWQGGDGGGSRITYHRGEGASDITSPSALSSNNRFLDLWLLQSQCSSKRPYVTIGLISGLEHDRTKANLRGKDY